MIMSMINEIKKFVHKDTVKTANQATSVKGAQVQAMLANGQAQIKDMTGRVSFVMAPQEGLEVGQNVYIQGNYVTNSRGPIFFPALEEYEV